MGSIPFTYPIIEKNFNIKKEGFIYEAYVWNYSLEIIKDIRVSYVDKNSNLLGRLYSRTLNIILSLYRDLTGKNNELSKIWNWYYLYYISNLFFYNLINKNNKGTFEKPNLLVINLRSKQLRISINTSRGTIFNLSVGRVLASLGLNNKSKKKSNKGDRLFIEYLANFFKNNINKFGIKKLCIIKVLGFKKGYTISENIFKMINKNFFILNLIDEFKLPNNYFKFKKVRSIKRRLKKRIIKDENFLK